MAWLHKIKTHFDKYFLALVLLVVFVINYTPGTFLTGWDNLMPELNIWMNIKRSLLAVWQQYQGLGLVGGMGHATDLIRQLLILPFTLILPVSLIRYLWHFFTIAFGVFGVYFGTKKIFHNKVPLISSLFYLLNFGTVQNYWAPFEPFSTFFGFFPWLMFSLWDTLKQPTRSNFRKLIILNLLAIPSFYVPTVFVVYLLCVFCILISQVFINHKSIINQAKILLIIFLLNSFWLLPFAYFLKNDVQNPQLGFGNLMSTEETVDRNFNRGHLTDFLLLRGYYYDLIDSGLPLMAAWQQHLQNPLVIVIAYFLSSIVILGLIRLIFQKNFLPPLFKFSIIFVFFICATALLSATPPFSYINQLIRQISFLDQVFRSPFTKFIVPTIFTFTLLFAIGTDYLFSLFKSKTAFFIFHASLIVFFIIYSFPVFTGHLIYPTMRQKIPREYFQLFNFFKKIPEDKRVANLPSGKFWGWTDYRFGVRGSGFIWYALEQPILDRAFDVWNLKNEQYYWQLNYAIQKQDPALLQSVFDQYHISYLIFDNNIFFPSESIYANLATPTREMLNHMPGISLLQQYGQIYIYQNKNINSDYTISPSNNISESPFFYQDQAFLDHPNYFISSSPDIIYPFSNLFSNRNPLNHEFPIEDTGSQIHLKKILNLPQKYDMIAGSNLSLNFSPTSHIELELPYQNPLVWESHSPNGLIFTSTNNSQNIFTQHFSDLTFDKSYLIQITYRHQSGYPLTLSAINQSGQHYFLFTKLSSNQGWQTDYFLIPKSDDQNFNTGLTLLFNSPSFDKQDSRNQLKSIKIIPFPYLEVIKTQLISKNPSPTNNYLIYPQSYHPGWLAFYFDKFKIHFLKGHTQANNWANAWIAPAVNNTDQTPIYFIFWPQILEFIGLIFIPILVFKYKHH